ncbi:MAG TPA: protein kinase [Polyangiaceae bacterium]|nr:protein kinase [Polyangiaceae bacterium]
MIHGFSQIPVGAVIAGKYRVERTLGTGGMGYVLAATHLELQQRVAIKLLHGSASHSTEAVARFVREARAASRIQSEHVARVIDVGRLENGERYTVMEFLEGRDLSVLLQQGPLPVQTAVDYVLQACHAVAEAHAAGIVHRDLKPSNLFLSRRPDGSGIIKVLDFGISKLTTGDNFDAHLTSTQTAMGTPLYMSPEQMRSPRDVDLRTDLWSLGAILYEFLSGRPPFMANSFPELVSAILESTPVPLSSANAQIPAALEAAVARCLEKGVARRFQSVGEFARELAPFASRESQFLVERVARLSGAEFISVPPEVRSDSHPKGVVSARPVPTHANWAHTQSAKPQRRMRVLIAAAGIGVLAAGAFAYRSWESTRANLGVVNGIDSARLTRASAAAVTTTVSEPAAPEGVTVAPVNTPEPLPRATSVSSSPPLRPSALASPGASQVGSPQLSPAVLGIPKNKASTQPAAAAASAAPAPNSSGSASKTLNMDLKQ